MQVNRRFTPACPPDRGAAQSTTKHEDSKGWRSNANCLTTDPELFFPAPSGPASAALAVCAACSVREDCLAHALRTREQHGVWGGTSERRRRRLIAQGVAR